MRIISGSNGGQTIKVPKNFKLRPTTDQSKEGIFNIISNYYDVDKLEVLDLFSGTGNISYEFASRNAKKITAVDKNIKCTNFINKMSLELDFNIKTITSDCFNFVLNTSDKFDIIFLDPPYNYNKYHEIKDLILEKKIIENNGCLIIEHDKRTIFDDKNIEKRKYGSVFFTMFNL